MQTTMPMTLGDARAAYYEKNQFGADGGDSLAWVPVKVLGITLKIPNTEARPSIPALRNSNRLHSSPRWFSTGVPLNARR